jgi:hypothetical protein
MRLENLVPEKPWSIEQLAAFYEVDEPTSGTLPPPLDRAGSRKPLEWLPSVLARHQRTRAAKPLDAARKRVSRRAR